MTKIYGALFAAVTVVGVWGMTRTHGGGRSLEIVGGRTAISFYPSILQADKLVVKTDSSAEGDPMSGEASTGFQIANSDLRFTLANGQLARFDGGAFTHKGGFKMVSGSREINAEQFQIIPSNTLANGLQLKVGSGKQAYVAFDLERPSLRYDAKADQMFMGLMDVSLTVDAAQKLGRPELAGKLVGMMSIYGNANPIDGGGKIEMPAPPPMSKQTPTGQDVALSRLWGISWFGHTGTYPNGLNGLSMNTESCNVGTQNIPWNAPMSTTHPVISMEMYRLKNGRLEMIGQSWLKHGFLATNQNGCGTCHDGAGSFLGIACSDIYATSNNGDRTFLGGRDEINAFTGAWTCQNSYFSNYINDCNRRNSGGGLDSVAHRLVVPDSELGDTNALYFYEANYIIQNDVNRYNNIGSVQCSMHWTGSQWTFNDIGGETQGPAIYRWGDMHSFAQPQDQGDIIVSVKTTDLGNGMWHYEYAVFNHTSDRQMRSFSVPMPSGMTVQNIGFHDIDQVSINDWPGVYANDSVSWSTGPFGDSTANPLKYGSLFNFRFDSNIPPVGNNAQLGLFKPGTGDTLLAATMTPVLLQAVDSFQVVNGSVSAGNLQSLAHWDSDRLSIRGNPNVSTGVIVTATAPNSAPASLTVGVVSNRGLNLGSSVGASIQSIELWNWTTSAWESVDSRQVTSADGMALATISSNAARFVSGSLQVQARVMQRGVLGGSSSGLFPLFNQIGFQYN